jgi:hypothetical protein
MHYFAYLINLGLKRLRKIEKPQLPKIAGVGACEALFSFNLGNVPAIS